MNFELGKEYIVAITDRGIVPIDEFDRERFYDKDNDDLDFLTDEEKTIIESHAYKKGLEDAWRYASGVTLSDDNGGIPHDKFNKIFCGLAPYDVFAKYTITEVIDKIKAYDDTHDFKVGDEIIFKKNSLYHEGKIGVIYKVLYDSDDNIYYLIRFSDGTFINHDGSNIKKTGKTYPYSPY